MFFYGFESMRTRVDHVFSMKYNHNVLSLNANLVCFCFIKKKDRDFLMGVCSDRTRGSNFKWKGGLICIRY